MAQNMDQFNSQRIERELCKKLEAFRLLKNISQTRLAEASGVSRRTISRMENGGGVSLDTFIRIMMALGLTEHLMSMLPSSEIRPIERVNQKRERKNASSPRSKQSGGNSKWEWGDQE